MIMLETVKLFVDYLIKSFLSIMAYLPDTLSSQWCYFNEDFTVMDP